LAQFTDDELFGSSPTQPSTFSDAELFNDEELKKQEERQLQATRDAAARANSVDLVTRSLQHAGFDDVTAQAGLPDATKQVLEDQRRGIDQRIEEDEQLKDSANQLAATQELRESVELLRALPEGRSVLDIQTEQLEQIPAVLRPFAVGAAQTSMRSASLVARGFEVLGFNTADVADDLSREAGALGQAQVQAGAGEIEQAATSAVSSIMEVMTAGSFGLGQKGIALAFGVKAANDAITTGRDAGLEGVQLAQFAGTQGIIEGAGTLLFNKLLGPGVERLGSIGRKEFTELVNQGSQSMLKRFALTGLAELPEEITIELLQGLNSQFQGVDPQAMTRENVLKTIRQTTMATLMTAGFTTGLETAVSRATPDAGPAAAQDAEPEARPAVLPPSEDSIKVQKTRLAELKSAAFEDQLTGLGNKRLDKRAVETLFKKADRDEKNISLVSFDIANFKSLNDTLGLQAGDRALQIIADSIQAEVRGAKKGRPSDVAGIATRPGGDEFNVLLPNTDTKGAQAVADRISARVDAALKEEGLDLPAADRPVFAAPGVVTRSPNDARSVEALREEADFAVKARKKAVKTELGVPLTREEADLEKTPESPAPPAVSEAPGPVAPAKVEPVRRAAEAATTPSQIRQAAKASKATLTPSELKRVSEGAVVSVRKRVRKKTVAQELTKAREGQEGAKKSKFSPEGFRSVRPFAERKLASLATRFKASDSPSKKDIAELLSTARAILPPAERGKLIPGLAKITNRRDALAQLGRISKAVEDFGQKIEADRLKGEQKALKKLGRKIPVPVRKLFGDDTITNLRTVDAKSLTAEEAKIRADQIAQLRGLIKELNNMRLTAAKESAVALQDELISEMKVSKPSVREETGRAGKANEFFNEQNTKPEELLAAMGPKFEEAFQQSMKAGEEITLRIKRDFSQNFEKKFDMSKLAKWGKSAGSKVKTAGFKLTSGRELELTYMELATTIASAKTDANREAILKSGLTLRRKLHQNRIEISEKDLALFEATARKLDPDIIKLANEAKRYLNQELKPQYDKAFQDLNNYSNIIEDYLPLQRNRQDFLEVPTEFDTQGLNQFTLEQLRETKERRGSNASVLIEGMDSLLDSHIRRMSLYIGQARPMRNANIMLNMPGVAKEMDSRFGTQRRAFLKGRMDHAVQTAVGFNAGALGFYNRLFSKLVTNATVGVLGINPFVIAKQVASMATAMTQMKPSLVLRGAKLGLSGKVDERMLQHSPQAWARYNTNRIRLVGQFEDASGNIFSRAKLQEKLMGGITKADRIVIRSIWRGAEIEMAENTDLKIGSEAYWAAVNKKFNEVVARTQPATSVFDQPGLSLEGRTNSLAKLAGAMFMSQRNQNFTMIRRALRKGGPEMWRDLGLVVALSPALVVMADLARAALYGYDEDKEMHERIADGMFRVVETNLSNIYGSQLAIEALQPIKQGLLGETINARRRENVVSASGTRILRGIQDLSAALLAESKRIESGPKRGKSKRLEKLKSALENLTVGIGTLSGIPVSTPNQMRKFAVDQLWPDDYGDLFKERSKLRKLDKESKLSDFQREKLHVIEENFEMVNVAMRASKAGAIEQEEANQYANDRMRTTIQVIAQLEKSTAPQTFTDKEKPSENEVLLREFYAEHGPAIFKFQIQQKEASLVETRFKRVRRQDQREFLAANPDAKEQIRAAKRGRRVLSALTKLRKKLTDPQLEPGLRASINARVKAILRDVE
jgi:diguanylate cyclase (GGDEF)-like protein